MNRPALQPDTTPTEAAAYVAELTEALATIARRHGLDTLGYLLDMANLEARNAASGANCEGEMPLRSALR